MGKKCAGREEIEEHPASVAAGRARAWVLGLVLLRSFLEEKAKLCVFIYSFLIHLGRLIYILLLKIFSSVLQGFFA